MYRRVAHHILSCHPPPDLRGALVLLPNYHAAKPLIHALYEEACLPALLLPEMTTLPDLAGTADLDCKVRSDTSRMAELYGALRERDWFPDANLWSLSCELLELMDELTRHHVELPHSAEEFSEQLALAYQARSGQAMQFEARVVHELWYAMAANGELSAAAAYQQRLAGLEVDRPVYVLMASDMPVPEARFLQALGERATIFDLREMAAGEPRCALLRSSLLRAAESADLRSSAASLKRQPEAALSLRLFGAHSLEQEALAAELQVRRWLLEGKRNIAIVAQDRLTARRVRALLERAGVLVCDETGWTMSTLSVSTVLMRWLDALQSDFYHLDLLDLLKSPFIFSDQGPDMRKQAAYQIEQLVRRHGLASGLDALLEMARGKTEAETALARLRQAQGALRRSSDTLGGWLESLGESLSMLGVLEGLACDEAGAQLLQALQDWQQELEGDLARFTRSEWRRWLAHQLDRHTFRDAAIESPVLLTHLAATHWRSFDAVLLLGADAAHLPGTDKGSLWFNDAVRASLDLPTNEARLAKLRDDLFALLAMNGAVLITWQASKNGESNLLSPYLEMLRAQHLLAFGCDLMDRELGELIEFAQVQMQDRGSHPQGAGRAVPVACATTATLRVEDTGCRKQGSGGMPIPTVVPELVPKRISPSGYNSLIACPYQYFARHVLHLNELDEVREGVEKRDYGVWVHLILHRFHEEFPVLEGRRKDELEAALGRISNEVFAPEVARDYLARAWLLRWQQAIPAYLEVQFESEAKGWRYQAGEMQFNLSLADDLTLHGRIDRIDATREGMKRVLDYKTASVTGLRNRLKEAGEDVQLACYALAEEAGEAAFISIDNEKVAAVAPSDDVTWLAKVNAERLLSLFAQMRGGAAMPAHGTDDACEHCEMRGLCRKGSWEPDGRALQERANG
jgi:ATP-dependent helicase/nuclease subunit B